MRAMKTESPFRTVQRIQESMTPKLCKVAKRPKHGGWDEGAADMWKDPDVLTALQVVEQV